MSKVTDCEIYAVSNPKSKIVAVGKIVFNGDIVVDGVKVIKGEKGLFVGMPSKKSEEKTWNDIVYASTKELKEEIKNAVLAKYNEQVKGGNSSKVEDSEEELPF